MDLHAPRRARVVLAIVSILTTPPLIAADSRTRMSMASNRASTWIQSWEPIRLDDRIASSRLVFLATRSPTMRDMLSVLAFTSGISVRLRSHPGLQEASWRLSHGVLHRDGGSLNAVLEFDTRRTTPAEQLEMVAHEIAHVVEIVCLPANGGAGQLETVLVGRGFRTQTARRRVIAVETLFAIEMGRVVVAEALTRITGAGKLQVLAHKHGLGAPCRGPDTDAAAGGR